MKNLTGETYRLPTEAEWEYAARGGNKCRGYKFSGSDILDEVAWNFGNSEGKTHTIGSKKPNELGIYDMSGNVAEWCQDWYGPYSPNSQTNPQGPLKGAERITRGGSWSDRAYITYCRIGNRLYESPATLWDNVGFRIAKDAK